MKPAGPDDGPDILPACHMGNDHSLRSQIQGPADPGAVLAGNPDNRRNAARLGGQDQLIQLRRPDRAVLLIEVDKVKPGGGDRLHRHGMGNPNPGAEHRTFPEANVSLSTLSLLPSQPSKFFHPPASFHQSL